MLKLFHLVYASLIYCERKYRLKVAKSSGMKVGKFTKFVGTQDFGSEPYLISIGRNALITDGVRFICHDGGIQVPLIEEGSEMASVYGRKSLFGRIDIGDNVFIGVGSVILLNSSIGENSIVAAGAVVKGRCPANSIIAGNPAKCIGTTSDYFSKNINKITDLSMNYAPARREEIIRKTSTEI